MRYVLLVSTLFLASVLLCSGTEVVQAATIDFESFDLGGAAYLNVAELLTFPDVGGSGVTVTITGHADIQIHDLFKFAPSYGLTGQALIDWPWPSGSNPAGTTFQFDKAVASCSLNVGDFGSDDDSPLKIRAFDENDLEIASDSLSWTAIEGPPFGNLVLRASGIRKVVFTAGGPYAGSVFIDYLVFEPDNVSVEPGTWGRLKALYR